MRREDIAIPQDAPEDLIDVIFTPGIVTRLHHFNWLRNIIAKVRFL